MSFIRRTQVIICCLLLASFHIGTLPAVAQQPAAGPVLSSVAMASPFGTVSVSGSGFTPNGLVRLIIHDLAGLGPTIDVWVVASSGTIDVTLPYLTTTIYGSHGSQDPAQGFAAGTISESLPVMEIFGPYGSQDPAQGYASSTMLWQGACPDLLVHALDVRAETWSNSLDVQFTSC